MKNHSWFFAVAAFPSPNHKKLAPLQERKFREKGASFVLAGAQDFELLLLLLLLLRILVQVYMENAHSLKLRRKLYVKKSLRRLRFQKRKGFTQVAL